MKRKFFVTQTKVIFCAAVETVCTLMCPDTKGSSLPNRKNVASTL